MPKVQQPISRAGVGRRQSRRYNRAGADIAPQTLGRSVAAAIALLSPIAREIRKETRASALLATDATGLPVLDEDHPHGIRNGTMWCWVGDNKWVAFFYAPSGDANSVKAFLRDDLLANGDLGGERTATMLTILGTCVAFRVNPRAYLHVVTRLIVNGWPNARLRELLPDRIVELHPTLRLPASTARPPPLLSAPI